MSELTTGAAMACDAAEHKEKSIGRSWKKRPFPSKPKRRQRRSLRSESSSMAKAPPGWLPKSTISWMDMRVAARIDRERHTGTRRVFWLTCIRIFAASASFRNTDANSINGTMSFGGIDRPI